MIVYLKAISDINHVFNLKKVVALCIN